MTWLYRVVLGALSVGLVGCGEGKASESAMTRQQGIVKGESSGAEQNGVLLLRAVLDGGSELLCSSSLVAPNLIITARHCVSYLNDGPFSCSVRGEPFDNPSGGGSLGLHLPAGSLEVYGGETPRKTPLAHGQQVISTLSPSICANDLAFVVLDTSLNLPPLPLRLGRGAEAGEVGVLVGYGLDESQVSIDYRRQPRQQKRDLEITAVGPGSIADGVTTTPPRALILQGPSGCIGDSGGPLLAQTSGAILGVYSLLAGASCSAATARHQLVHVPPFTTLISDAFTAAGAEPLLEPELGAAGAADSNSRDETAGAAGAGAGAGADAGAGGGVAGATEMVAARKRPSPSCRSAPAGSASNHWALLVTLTAMGVARRCSREKSFS